jgi:nicotinamide riboside kinase
VDNQGPLHHAETGATLRSPEVARIGLIGAESSGKSTLATALARELPACVVAEALRTFVEERGRPPRQDEQPQLMSAQAEAEEHVAASCGRPWLVADPAPLMTAVYSIAYFDDDALLEAGLQHACAYRLLVWCDPGIPWQPDDGQRDGPARRAGTDAIIDDLVQGPIGAMSVDVLKVTGSVAQRVAAVLERLAWQPEPSRRPT